MTNRAQRTNADRAAAAARARKRYRRAKVGLREYRIDLPETICAEAMVQGGWLSRRDANDPEKVRLCLTRIIERILRLTLTREDNNLKLKNELSENHNNDDSLGAPKEKPSCLVA